VLGKCQEHDRVLQLSCAFHESAEDDWALVHSGAKPSDYPDFMFLTNCVSAGFGTPAAA
jgi:hypothetical protein